MLTSGSTPSDSNRALGAPKLRMGRDWRERLFIKAWAGRGTEN